MFTLLFLLLSALALACIIGCFQLIIHPGSDDIMRPTVIKTK